MARDRFRDGAAILATYEWAIGHETEDPEVNTLNLERTALTTGVDFVRQEGAPSPKVFRLHGWANKPSQIEKMEAYYNACAGIGTQSRTVFYQDVTGVEREVLITAWEPVKKIGRSGGTGLAYVWQYSITMEVI